MTYFNGTKITILIAEFYKEIADSLLHGALSVFKDHHIQEENIHIIRIPGAYELPQLAQKVATTIKPNGILCLGCVIQGETKHFDYVCQGATNGIMSIGLRYNKPATFCVLTDQNEQQSIDRSGGKHGNKGMECAVSCLKMIELNKDISSPDKKIGF